MIPGFLSAGLGLRTVGGDESVPDQVALLAAVLAERGTLPPPGMILDLGALALGGADSRIRTPTSDDPALADALRGWADRVVARIAGEPGLDRVADALRSLAPEPQRTALAWWVCGVLARLDPPGADVLPARVRALADAWPEPTDEAEDLAALAAAYVVATHRVVRVDQWVGPADAFVVGAIDRLGSHGRRVAFAQLVDAAATLDRLLPQRIRRSGATRGPLPTRIQAESAFPAGGFASVSTSGALENLVTSELIYMEDRRELDLFDLRWAEGELLYYARDEGAFTREPREIAWLIGPDLAGARFRDPGSPVQRHLMALAAAVAGTLRLARVLAEQELAVRLVFLTERGESPLAAESGLAALALRDAIARGVASVETLDPIVAWESLAAAAGRAHVDAIWLSAEDPPPAPKRVRVHRPGVGPADLAGWADRLRIAVEEAI